MAKDIFEQKGFRSKWILYSAYHKNLRLTATSRAMEWLEVLLRITTPENLRKYLIKISLEETRSINLLKKLQDKKLSVQELTHEFATTHKKWHSKRLQGSLINDWYYSYLSTLELIKSGNRPINVNPTELKSNHLYQSYWYYKLTKTDDSEFWFGVANIHNDELREFINVRPSGSYARMFASDLVCGLGSVEEKTDIKYHKTDGSFRIPHFETFVFDVHVSKGKKLTIENIHLIYKNEHKVPDLRLSGCVVSNFWRLQTIKQFGDLFDQNQKLRNWSQTDLPMGQYDLAIGLDTYYYPSVFKRKLDSK